MEIHPGAKVALRRLTSDELDIARMMAEGDLTSPQHYHNVALFNIRITGTGISYRPALDEFVYRKPENYLTDDFLARCNGLPVIMQHPKKSLLTSDEFAERVVGTVMLPYLSESEVWAIAKLYDDETIHLLEDKQMSTSPSVLLDKGQKIRLEDGKHLLVEGKPSLLDHIAICSAGVWDKGGDPTGIETTAIGDSAVAEEDKKVEESAKADAARADAEKLADEKFDLLLKGIDSVRAALDSANKRMDAFEEVKETEKKADAEEVEKAVTNPKETEAKELAADKRKDAEEDTEAKERADSIAVLAAQNRDLQRQIRSLSDLVRQPIADSHREELSKVQARADDVLVQLGKRAPAPLVGESPLNYRRRVIADLKPMSTAWKAVKLDSLPPEAFEIAEGQIYADAIVCAKQPTDIAVGRMREVRKTLPTGHVVTEFYGNDTHFVRSFSRPPRRVASVFTGR